MQAMMRPKSGFTLLLLFVSVAAASRAPAGGQCAVFGQADEELVVLEEGSDEPRTLGDCLRGRSGTISRGFWFRGEPASYTCS